MQRCKFAGGEGTKKKKKYAQKKKTEIKGYNKMREQARHFYVTSWAYTQASLESRSLRENQSGSSSTNLLAKKRCGGDGGGTNLPAKLWLRDPPLGSMSPHWWTRLTAAILTRQEVGLGYFCEVLLPFRLCTLYIVVVHWKIFITFPFIAQIYNIVMTENIIFIIFQL